MSPVISNAGSGNIGSLADVDQDALIGAVLILFFVFMGTGLLLVILYICLRRLGYTMLLCKWCQSKNDEAGVSCRRSTVTLRSMTASTTLDQIATPILRVSFAPGDAHDNAALEFDTDVAQKTQAQPVPVAQETDASCNSQMQTVVATAETTLDCST